MFPNDAVTVYRELVGPTTYMAVGTSTFNTVLNIRMQQSGTASESRVYCGNASGTISLNYAKDFSEVNGHFPCQNKAIYFSKTGQDSSFMVMTYVPYNIASSTATSTGTTTIIASYGGMNYGDAMLTASVIIGLLSLMLWRLIFKK